MTAIHFEIHSEYNILLNYRSFGFYNDDIFIYLHVAIIDGRRYCSRSSSPSGAATSPPVTQLRLGHLNHKRQKLLS